VVVVVVAVPAFPETLSFQKRLKFKKVCLFLCRSIQFLLTAIATKRVQINSLQSLPTSISREAAPFI